MKRNAVAALIAALCILPLSRAAHAACTAPDGAAGTVVYNTASHAPQYCDGTNWIAFVSTPGDGGSGGTCTGGDCDGAITLFVSSAAYGGGAVGGVAGADAKCQALADAQTLGGTYYAWIADSTDASAPVNRFDIAGTGLPIRLIDGTLIADNWADLVDADNLYTNIIYDELGIDVGSITVWTNVAGSGARAGTEHCVNWTAGGSTGIAGSNAQLNSWWTYYEGGATPSCFGTKRLYCFEQEVSTGGGTCTNPAGAEGTLIFNDDLNVMQYCEGDEWVSVGTCSDYASGNLLHLPLNEGSGATVARSAPPRSKSSTPPPPRCTNAPNPAS